MADVVLLATLGIPALLIAGCLWAARRGLERVSPAARVTLGALFCLAPLAVGAYCARQDLENAHQRPGTMYFLVLFLAPAVLLSLAFLARARTRRLSALGAVSIALAVTAFAFGGPLWMRFAPPASLFREPYVVIDVRRVQSAQVGYAASNNGAYGRLPCLAAPSECGLPAGASSLLYPELADLRTRYGYRRSFFPGAAKPGAPDPSGLSTFAYVAVPVERSRANGMRGFCGDDTGRVCATSDGSAPLVVGGRCPEACPDLK